MVAAPKAFDELKTRLAQVTDLSRVRRILDWDMQVLMPPRARRLAASSRRPSTAWRTTSSRPPRPTGCSRSSVVRGLARPGLGRRVADPRLRKDYEKQVRVPAELRAESIKAATAASMAWRQARPANDFESFRPFLERHLELRHATSSCSARPTSPTTCCSTTTSAA